MKFVSLAKNNGLAQIYSKGLEYALVNAEGKQCTQFAFCKDFLQDAVYSHLSKKKVSIYGFSYEPDKDPELSLDKTRMALRIVKEKKEKFGEMIEKTIKFMNEIEKKVEVEESSGEYLGEEGDNHLYLIQSDKVWQMSPVLLSLYTLLLRVGLTYKDNGYREHMEKGPFFSGNDSSYLSKAKSKIDEIIDSKLEGYFSKEIEKNYFPEGKHLEIYKVHNGAGIVGLSTGAYPEELKKHWNIAKEEKSVS